MNKVFITGDFHGEARRMNDKRFRDIHQGTERIPLICLGDFGFLWYHKLNSQMKLYSGGINISYRKKVEDLERKLINLYNTNFDIFFVDGNHENFDIIDKLETVHKFGADMGVYRFGPNDSMSVHHLRRGRVYDIYGKKCFVFGGAVSVDKDMRTPGISWWDRELPSFSEYNKAEDNLANVDFKVDYVFTHTCPTWCSNQMYGVYNSSYYPDPVANFLDQLWDKMSFKYWGCGHMHVNRTLNKDDKAIHLMYENVYELDFDCEVK